MGNVEHGIEAVNLYAGAGFLKSLTHGRLLDGLPVFHESCGYGPKAVARLDPASAKQYSPLPLGNTTGNDFGVSVMNFPASITDMPLAVIPLRYPDTDWGSTLTAEFHNQIAFRNRHHYSTADVFLVKS